jgi:hypothetical protein
MIGFGDFADHDEHELVSQDPVNHYYRARSATGLWAVPAHLPCEQRLVSVPRTRETSDSDASC